MGSKIIKKLSRGESVPSINIGCGICFRCHGEIEMNG